MDELDDAGASVGTAAVSFDEAGIPIVKLSGEIDISNVDSVRSTVEPVIDGAPKCVVFDLSALEFLDSSGITLLLQAAARTGSVRLHEPSPLLRRIIEANGLSGVFGLES